MPTHRDTLEVLMDLLPDTEVQVIILPRFRKLREEVAQELTAELATEGKSDLFRTTATEVVARMSAEIPEADLNEESSICRYTVCRTWLHLVLVAWKDWGEREGVLRIEAKDLVPVGCPPECEEDWEETRRAAHSDLEMGTVLGFEEYEQIMGIFRKGLAQQLDQGPLRINDKIELDGTWHVRLIPKAST